MPSNFDRCVRAAENDRIAAPREPAPWQAVVMMLGGIIHAMLAIAFAIREMRE